MLISYKWLKSYIPDVPDVDKLTELITFKLCEIESVETLPSGDTVFDLKILPDRAHDLLSHRGVAKEIAGMLGIQFSEISSSNSFPQVLGSPRKEIGELGQTSSEKNNSSEISEIQNQEKTNLQIDIQSPNCRRYMGRIVRDVKVGPSPKWMVERLESVGQRSINNIVDITNFVLFGLGQPTHIFDLDKLDGEKIIIRNAKEGEQIDLLGFEKINDLQKSRSAVLGEKDLIIADEKNTLALAGIKGGIKAEISDSTKNIMIEVASFNPITTRKTARKFNILTDAVKRYENDLSPTLCDQAMEEISSLILEVCPEAKFEEVVDVYKEVPEIKKVSFTTNYVSNILGVKISNEEIEKILKNYKYEFVQNDDSWEIVVPPMRIDITDRCNMAEEIGRAYGYDKIVPELPDKNSFSGSSDNPIWTKICIAKEKLINNGYREVFTSVFTNSGEVEILASASDKSFLRTNISDGLKKAYELNRLNAPLLDIEEIKIFEVGGVFLEDKEEIHVVFCDKKNNEEIELGKFVEKEFSENPSDYSFPQVLGRGGREPVPDHSEKNNPSGFSEENSFLKNFKPWSVYPFISRDISVWVPNSVTSNELKDIYKGLGTELLVCEPKLFDQFTKGEKTSYAFRLVFQSYDRTLVEEEVSSIMSKITEKIVSNGWEVR